MRNSPRRQRVRSAFTLVEVMVAAAVMVLTIVGMLQVVMSGARMLDTARKQTIAMQVIHGQIESIRLSTWTEVSALAADVTVQVVALDANGVEIPQTANLAAGFDFSASLRALTKEFSCRRVITTVRTDLKQVTYTVTWRSQGVLQSRAGTTYVARNGLYVTYQR